VDRCVERDEGRATGHLIYVLVTLAVVHLRSQGPPGLLLLVCFAHRAERANAAAKKYR
jgi:hypothetical protein